MLATMNPYENVDIDSFRITAQGMIRGYEVFRVFLARHKPFDSCVFRDHLVRFLFDHMRDHWHLGNDDSFIQFSPDDLCLALSPSDAKRFRDYGWMLEN